MKTKPIFAVTGGLGFIGKHFVRRLLEQGVFVKNIDSESYAADLTVRDEFDAHPNYKAIKEDITELNFLPQCDVLVNFAAESHVDNAITSNLKFCQTNFMGVQRLLELVRAKPVLERALFVQISTDEVYGDIVDGAHSEADRLIPSNPYSASKAAADMLVQSWGRTYNLPWLIIRPTNNYGHHQYPEKLIPKSVWRIQRGLPAVMHGDGSYVRTWLHVEDTVDALLTVIEKGSRNTIYNVAGSSEKRNIDVLRIIASQMGVPEKDAWVAVEDRSGQDVRYSLDDSALRALNWSPSRDFDSELKDIVDSVDATRFA